MTAGQTPLWLRSEAVAGVRAPVSWGAATAVVALISFGAPLTWGSIGAAIGLLLWGALAMGWIDNLVRRLVISGVPSCSRCGANGTA